MAAAFPNSTFVGFDYHEASIVRARELAREEGVNGNTSYAVAGAKDFPGRGYDLVCAFDCLHVLRRLDAHLLPGLARPGGRARLGRPGRRGAPALGRH
jgi:cyclopropane fatty-acyl-phospholipid synthase-like methyltransferase